jgi:hypothetical protein
VAGWVMSARRVVIPGRGAMGWRSMETILTSGRGWDCVVCCEGAIDCSAGRGGDESGKRLSICWRSLASWSCHATRPNFSPLMSTRERTWDQLPGAAQRSTTLVTLEKRSNSAAFVSSVGKKLRGDGKVRLTLVQLEELEGAAGAPALLFREAVVSISLVFGDFAHSGNKPRISNNNIFFCR